MSTEMIDYQGDFEHCLLTEYDKYIEGDYNDKKVLIVKDSFGLPVSAFMSTTCKNLTIYDPRCSHDESLTQFIQNGDFDLVIFVYNPESLSSKMFNFTE